MPRGESFGDVVLDSAVLWAEENIEDLRPMLVVGQLERTRKLVDDRLEASLGTVKITFTRFVVLSRIYWTRSGALTLGEIAQMLVVHPTTVTSTVDRLERDGLVRREQHPTDRRATLVRVTPAGRRLAKRATSLLLGARMGFEGVDADLLEELSDVLRRVRISLGDTVGDGDAYESIGSVGTPAATGDRRRRAGRR